MNAFADTVRVLQPFAIAISFVTIYIAEHIIPQRRELIDHKHDGKNVLVGLLNLAMAGVGGYFLQRWLTYTGSHNVCVLHFLPAVFWLRLVVGFILIDIIMYWWHRVNHEYRFLWQFHRFHHIDEKMNSTTAIRFHGMEILFSYVVRFTLFPLLGIDIAAVFLHGLILFPVILFHRYWF